MDQKTALIQLCEYYAIPPYHNSPNRGSLEVKSRLEGVFGGELSEVERRLKFDHVKNAYDSHMRRVGKEITQVIKQACR